ERYCPVSPLSAAQSRAYRRRDRSIAEEACGMMRQILLVPAMLALILALATALSHPVLPDPTTTTVDHPLADPALEARARALMREIRCVVCQSQSIDESN